MQYIKVGIVPVADIFNIKTNENGDIGVKDGLEAEVLNMLSQGLGLKFKYGVPKLLNSSHEDAWTALISMVKIFEVDLAISKISRTEKRSLLVNYSYPYTIDEMTFAIRIPTAIPNTFAFVNPFSKNLWIGVLILWMVYPLIFQSFQAESNTNKNLYLHFFGSFLHQNLSLTTTNRQQTILLTLWLLGAIFLSLSYTTTLLSFMTVPFRENGIRTIAELAKAVGSGNYSCAQLTGSGSYEMFYQSNEPNLQAIGQSFDRNYIEFSPDKSHVLTQMYMKKLVMVATRRDLHNLLDPHVFIASETFGILPLCVVFNNNFKQVGKLNEVIHRIAASGIYEKSVRDYMFLKRLRSNAIVLEEQQQLKQLTIIDLIGVFSLLIVGILFSILTLIAEFVFWKLMTHQ